MAPTIGTFGPAALSKLRAVHEQIEQLQKAANEIVALVLEANNHDLSSPINVKYDVSGDNNQWSVVPSAKE